jgi:hypothetical protein
MNNESRNVSPVAIKNVLNNRQSPLNNLIKHAKLLQLLTDKFRSILPKPLNEHVFVTSIEKSVLTVVTDSSVWASLLHYHTTDILNYTLSINDLPPVKKIRIKVSPFHMPETPKKTQHAISTTSAQQIKTAATSIQDPKLRAALLKLAE